MIKESKKIIVALDQSLKSAPNTLKHYGLKDLEEKDIQKEINKMRERIITNKYFTNDKILGVILPFYEIDSIVDDKNIIDYLLDKGILTFIKIDEGLVDLKNGVRLMKNIEKLDKKLDTLKRKKVYGTKMRSLITEDNKTGIREIIEEQFKYAKIIYKKGLIPIVEPEIDINCKNRKEIEKTLKEEINRSLEKENDIKIILKLTPPVEKNYYLDYTNNEKIIKVVFLSGGYSKTESCNILKENQNAIASFSRAFLEDLNITDSDEIFSSKLKTNIENIYEASLT